MTRPVAIAVAGAGLIGKAHIARVLGTPGARLAAIIDPAPSAKAQAETLGVPWFADLEAGLDAARPDGVVLATPNTLHVSGGLAAIARGIPALVEKPVADTVEHAERLADASEKAGVPILVGHHHRHSAMIRSAKQTLASGRLGRIVAVNALYWFRKPDAGYFDGPGSWRREPGGGVILINLIHMIDDLRNLCGDVVRVQAVASNAVRGFAVEDTAAMILTFASGALGTVALSDTAASPWSWEFTAGENKAYPFTTETSIMIAGTQGSLSVPRLDVWEYQGEPHWFRPISTSRTIVPESDPLTEQMAHFCAVVRGEATPVLDARGGARTLATTLAVKKAAETGGVVTL